MATAIAERDAGADDEVLDGARDKYLGEVRGPTAAS
jgi:hypothetical protein